MPRSAALGLLIALVIGVGTLAPMATAEALAPVIVKVHAAWCGTCTRLNPTWDALEQKYGDRAQLVVLDVTDRETMREASATAQRLGFAAFFAEYKARTGVIAILDPKTARPLQIFKGETRLEPYEEAMREWAKSS